MKFPSFRLFSLHVPVPPKVFLSMVYKFEGSTDVQVALELTTGDASSCHVGGMLVLNGERLGGFLEGSWRRSWLWAGLLWAELMWTELMWAGLPWVGLCGRGCCGRGGAAPTLGGICGL